MSAHQVIWRLAATMTMMLAAGATLVEQPVGPALGLGVCLAGVGAIVGLVFRADYPQVRHPSVVGAASFVAPSLLPGLALVAGPVAAAVMVALLVVTAPLVSSVLVDLLRGRALPSQTQVAGMAQRAEALRLQWEQSTRMLETSMTTRERLQMVILREQILDDLLEQTGGVPPMYVWASPRGHGGLGRSGIGT